MQSKPLREGALGLLILVGVVMCGGIFVWLRGLRTGDVFTFKIKFGDASGVDVGSIVRYRGVQVGRVLSLQAESGNVNVTVSIDNAKLAIPRQSAVETNQTGFISTTTIDIRPQSILPASTPNIDPIAANCNTKLIVCQGNTIDGTTGVSLTQLMRESSMAFRKINDDQMISNLNTTLITANEALGSFKKLSDSANDVVGKVSAPIEQFGNTANAIAQAASDLSKAANTADDLFVSNREKLASTLDSISGAAKEARSLLEGTKPLLDNGKFVANLQKLSDNAATASENLRLLSTEVNNPATIGALREMLDSARATFANTQKITADLDDLTGDPKFRTNLRNLVNGLSGLVSSNSGLEFRAAIPGVAPTSIPANSSTSIDNSASSILAKTKSLLKQSTDLFNSSSNLNFDRLNKFKNLPDRPVSETDR